MIRTLIPSLVLVSSLIVAPRAGAAPEVAADIAPVHALVARVMQGSGAAPVLLLPPGQSPHHAALAPSQGAALSRAALVVWMGPELSPALARALDRIAGGTQLDLLRVPGAVRLPPRASAGHDHGDAHGEDHAHAHEAEPAAGKAGDVDHAHDEHGSDHARGAEHAAEAAHGHAPDATGPDAADPHAWLDPANAAVWVGAIAEALAAEDPGNAELYRANAEAAAAELSALQAELDATLAPLRGRPLVPFHDALQYMEARFGLTALGALGDVEAAARGPSGLAALREEIAAEGAACLLAEPQHDRALAERVAQATGLPLVEADVLGAGLEPGPDLYPHLMRGLAAALLACR